MENTCIQTNLPLVSVLIPTHERPHYFSLALASVINQTYQNIEIIISDNSCDDETEAIVKSFQAAYRNIRYFHSPGMDMESNWQTCWDNMSPESVYVNFLMDDDIFAPTKIEVMVAILESHPELVLATSYRKLIDGNGELLPDKPFNSKLFESNTIADGQSAGKQIFVNCSNFIGEPTTVLFRKKCADGYFRGWTGDEKYLILDYPLWLRLLEKGDFVYIAQPLSFFRQHESNDTKDFLTSIRFPLSFAYAIQTAWNRKIYLTNLNDLKKTISLWLKGATDALLRCYEEDYHGEYLDDLQKIYKCMSLYFLSDGTDDIAF